MKVLITGATGLVGSALTRLLQDNGVFVNYLSTSRNKLKDEALHKGYYWNPEQGIIDKDCIDGVEVIFHLAGASISKRWTKSYKEEILDSRVGTADLLRKLLSEQPHTVHHLISASAIGIYPDSLTAIYSEDSVGVDDSFLGEVVVKWEAAVDKFETLGIKVAKVRTGLVLSGNGGALAEMVKPVKLGIGSAYGSGTQMQSWIHAEDLARIYYFILENELEGIYNGVAPHPVSNYELIKAIAKVLDKPFFMPNVPRFFMKLVLGEMHMLLFTSQNVSARKIVSEGFQFQYLSLEKALTEALK